MAAAPLIVTALFGDGDNGWLQELRRVHYPPDRNRVPAHLTLFHQLPPSAEGELHRRLAAYAAAPPPRAAIAGLMDLGGGTALRIASEELADMRYELALGLSGLLTPQDRAPWTPHVTIQNKVEPKEARRLQQMLRGRFEGRPLTLRGLATWRYLDGPWEQAKHWTFRG
ncbi:MAG: 2'-5' RNA ligase family protein [Alphaproteobacteria bacterium]|nr:2'-5' RNA ligase family protein [Alphaproteobacteria bacterium]MBV9371264.1 2'-5' RNA ligase family protein [Alphaproteobacteria bacterium]MBV9902797.1 2'-5' RNA ligase family protein [Alphaproteobacteria bacterium]